MIAAHLLGGVVLFLCTLLAGCAAQVGPSARQTAADVSSRNQGPTEMRMVDVDRGSMTSSGVGAGVWTRLDSTGLEKMSTGTTPRDIYYDEKTGRLVLSSGTDINAEGIEFKRDAGGGLASVKIAKFGTSASTPIIATNQAYPDLAAYWASRDEASRQVITAQVSALENSVPGLAALIFKAMGVP